MSSAYHSVIHMVIDFGLEIVETNEAEELIIIEDYDNGIHRLILDVEEPLLILEQSIMPVPAVPRDFFEFLLKINRVLIHGAFCLTEDGRRVIWRDTLRIEQLDAIELQSSIDALSLAMAEHGDKLLQYAKYEGGPDGFQPHF